jgi:hypothetical protein
MAVPAQKDARFWTFFDIPGAREVAAIAVTSGIAAACSMRATPSKKLSKKCASE